MDKTPKERIVFDEGVYYGDEGSEISIEDITSREGITVEEVLDSYTDEEIFENAMNMMDIDRSEELAGLKAFLDGSDNPLSSYDNPLGGNRIIARGSIGRWDGTRHGLTVYRDFDDMMSGPDSVFKDCEIGKVWDENGGLFIHGYHHDGGVDVEVRQLTDAGEEALDVIEGERYGAGGGFVYGKALSNDCQLYGHGLPLVEFYDVSQDPAKFPEGQFVSRYFMSTLLGMDSIGDSIGEMSAFGLDGGVPDWTIRGDDLQEVYAHLCAAREQLESYTECGTYKDYGFGFHAKEGSMSSYVIGEPVEEGWWVLVGNYDLTDSDSDYYISDDLLNELLSRHGYPSMDALKESQADMWRNELTAIIAEAQEDSRFEVPFHLSSDESMLRHIVKRMGVPEEAARTAVANARAMYEKDAPRREPEKVVTLKGEVDKARRASAKLADNGNHSNRGQDAR